jgi:hypothetical protein
MIASVVSPKQATQTWGYDTLGRVNSMDLKVDSEDLKATLAYDATTGLPRLFTYPEAEGGAPLITMNVYDAHGNLTSVVDTATKRRSCKRKKAWSKTSRRLSGVAPRSVLRAVPYIE